ncbi:MAG: TonB-dependent receptor [Salinivirgaceae bacterium]|nr:TonB-dependent receptor [Salinivirgaceae bacterium]
MKAHGHILLVLLLVFSSHGFTQVKNSETEISVHFSNTKLENVLKELSEKTGQKFSYSTNTIPANFEINYTAKKESFENILNEICKQAGVSYENVGGYLVLKKADEIIQETEILKAKKFTISGYIVDSKNQEALIGAAVYNEETNQGTTTNNYGFFSFTLPEGNYSIKTSYMGYDVASKQVELYNNFRWNIKLEPTASMMQEVVVSSFNREKLISNQLAAQTNIKPFAVKQQTAALGETDMLKSLDNLPGISFQSDGSSYFYVRGGNRDQNLILLDEAPIYNPSHMLGLFTPIIPDAIKNTTIYKADFPIQYGGRLSSLIDIRTRDGNMEKFSGSSSIGLVSARISVEGPIKKEASSFFTSFRRSYFGVLVKAGYPKVKDFYFNDFTSKFNLRLGKKDRLFLTLYNGKDILLTEETVNNKSGLEWGNTSFTTRWNHIFGSKLFLNTTFYASKYDYFLHTDYSKNINWNSHISSAHVKSEFTWYLNPNHKIYYGLKLGRYYFNPGNYNDPKLPSGLTVSPINSGESILYVGNEYQFSENLQLNAGLRFTSWRNFGEGFVVNYTDYQPIDTNNYKKDEKYYSNLSVEPRISISYKLTDFSSLKASYNRTLQHINLINNSISPFNSLEVWLPSGPNIKPQKADIINLGFIKSWPAHDIDFNVDVYYKKLYNQIGYKYHAKTMLNPFLDGELRQGDGKAYGFEVYARKTQGRITGQVGYSFTRSLIQIDDLNDGREFKARQDRPVDFSLGLSFLAKPRWLLTANFSYSSGARISSPTSFYFYRGVQVPVYTEQNNDRMPDYKRFDIGTDFKLNKKEGNFEHHLVISFYNFFNTHNPGFLYFNKVAAANGDLKVPADKLNYQELSPSTRYVYTMVPSITYNMKF